jgi:hypothetical protein
MSSMFKDTLGVAEAMKKDAHGGMWSSKINIEQVKDFDAALQTKCHVICDVMGVPHIDDDVALEGTLRPE